MEMMNTSVGLKLIVNPDDQKIEKEMDNKTVKQYWENDPRSCCLIEKASAFPLFSGPEPSSTFLSPLRIREYSP